ncbi:MAG TPA: hypothetical protein VIC52_05915 [Actinomycetota bacterium]
MDDARTDVRRRGRRFRRCIGVVSAAALVTVMSCARDVPPDAPATGGSSSDAPAAENGEIAFSRAIVKAEGQPASAEILTVDPDGGEPQLIAGEAVYRSAPAWSPDGDSLAFTSFEGIVVATDDGGTDLLAPCRRSCLGFGAPAWSPDGERLAWSGTLDGRDGLIVASILDPDPRIVRELSIRGVPAWSPDGSAVAVLEATAGGSTIVLIDVATGDAIREIDSALEIGASIAWSPDGELFAVEARDSGGGLGAGIYVMGTDGSEPRLVSSCPDAGCTDLEPAWSPDGTMLAFTRARCDDPGSDCFTGDIAVVAVGGGRVRTVTSERPLDCCAAWGTGNT